MAKRREFKYNGNVKLYKCTCCWEFLPKNKFSENVLWYDFINSECKECYAKRAKKYRHDNKDKIREAQKAYREKRRMMMNSRGWRKQKQEEPFSSDFARAEQMRTENNEAEVQTEDNDLIIQAAIDKNPDAYTEILSDEDLLNAFNNRSIESKINELTRRQQKFDKQKAEKEYNIMKEKMRDLVDATLNDEQKKRFEDKLHSLHEAQQDEFVRKVSKLSTASFPVSREAIFEAQLDIQTGKIKSKDVII